ncbi:ATP-binding protein [Nonomuraea phyllanthi]|jgi:anti-sigma regulatory factor (Ser/Thr protein kinase)|uniref:ATP-binding protein n=1 Tax=Nonomuraea phyllanthi TaxID=2219224 RepID=A0A5C4W9P6_9ACTN|nr:ATP-binding protein [Nonomuraea phyllanthi]KAB8192611.1 ATP-binding protein [Nonomuraea phyllanthi]QFY08088.1 ATP-binding protein [Nonomuraea phyllanthi]
MINVQSTTAPGQWTTFDWWPPIGWWPEAARDLLVPGPSPGPSASATFVLPPTTASVHSARSFTTGALSGWGLGELAENMELVVSELATNALRHGLRLDEPCHQTPVHMSLVRRGALVTCAFTDPGASVPVLRYPGPLDTGGLGLHIVESLSLRWGWSALAPHGKIVWAVLS